MNSPTITMERESALAKLGEYEEAAKRNPRHKTDLDKQIMQGYRILARGGRMVDVNEALRHGGLNLAGQPKLAIARADATFTDWMRMSDLRWNGPRAYYVKTGITRYKWVERTSIRDDRVQWLTADGCFPTEKLADKLYRAFTPLIPLPHRPKRDLSNYFLLWEANWHPAPPVDPYLLRPVAGSLMEVIAEWEVSAIELAAVRAAMR